jgi:hypothetical protein
MNPFTLVFIKCICYNFKTKVNSRKHKVYPMFGFTIYLMHFADYLRRKKSKKQKDSKTEHA